MEAKTLNAMVVEVKNEVNVKDLITSSRKRPTYGDMIDAVKGVFESGEEIEKKLNILFDNYQKEFINSARYIPAKMKLVVEKIIQERTGNSEFKLLIGEKLRVQFEKGKTPEVKVEKLNIAETFKSGNNSKLAAIVQVNKLWKNNLSLEEIRMVKLALQDKSTSEIGEEFGYSKDKVYTLLFRNNGKSVLNKLGA